MRSKKQVPSSKASHVVKPRLKNGETLLFDEGVTKFHCKGAHVQGWEGFLLSSEGRLQRCTSCSSHSSMERSHRVPLAHQPLTGSLSVEERSTLPSIVLYASGTILGISWEAILTSLSPRTILEKGVYVYSLI